MRILLLIFFFNTSNLVFSQLIQSRQDSVNNKYSIGLEYNYNILTNYKSYATLLSFGYEKISIKIGPIFSNNELYGNIEDFELAGGLFSFEYNPNNKARIFDFYFLANLAYYQFKREESRYYYYDYRNFKSAYRTTLGYGFNFKIYKGLYIKNSISFGVSFEKTKRTDGVVENNNDFYGYFIGGIGYNLGFGKINSN